MSFNNELTLLSDGQIWGDDNESQLDVIKKYGTKASLTDLCILTGGYVYYNTYYNIDEDSSLKGRTGWSWTRSNDNDNDVRMASNSGTRGKVYRYLRNGAIRPVLPSSAIFSQISPKRVRGYNKTKEIIFGEYPQYAADSDMQKILEFKFTISALRKTGRSYTFDSVKYNDYDREFTPVTYKEYEYRGKRYIRIKANSCFNGNPFILSNGVEYKDGDYVWVEVSPIVWLIDDKTGLLISKRGLVSGIRFLDIRIKYKGIFSKTEMNEYLNKYMIKDITQSITLDNQERINTDIVNDTSFIEVINRIEKLSVDKKSKFLDYLLNELLEINQNKVQENQQILQKVRKLIDNKEFN